MRQLSPDEQTADALAHSQTSLALDAALAYLKRLPSVPATQAIIERIETERAEPAHQFARRRADEARAAAGVLTGNGKWPSSGEPPLVARLDLDNMLTLRCFEIDRRPRAAAELLKDLASGAGIRLKLERSRD